MSRSSKKGPYVDQRLLKNIKYKAGWKTVIKTWSRDSKFLLKWLVLFSAFIMEKILFQ